MHSRTNRTLRGIDSVGMVVRNKSIGRQQGQKQAEPSYAFYSEPHVSDAVRSLTLHRSVIHCNHRISVS